VEEKIFLSIEIFSYFLYNPHMKPMKDVLKLPGGARFYRCALQVNPFEYVKRHNRSSEFSDENGYNTAIVDACLKNEIKVIAITDHYRIRTSNHLAQAAREAGIYVFPGFEAVTKDGVHFLCLFNPDKDIIFLERVLGDCGIHQDEEESPTGKYDAIELLKTSHENSWGAVCIAAHVTSNGGLLHTLKGKPAINVWNSPYLLACAIPGPIRQTPENIRRILENKNKDYLRERPVAILNAHDVSSPEDLTNPGASCWIKMSKVSVEGLRQAFLDPESRIRLVSDKEYEAHEEFVAVVWEGGFLDGTGIHFNENLNVLIGGRGTGKSTVIESIRYVLGINPSGNDARKTHEDIVQQVLRNGTKISLQVRSHRPTTRNYFIERTIPNPPMVKDESGKVLELTPSDIIPQVEVYGQHEISELTRNREKLTRLLERFVDRSGSELTQRKNDLKRELERSRNRIIDIDRELEQIEEGLASLPMLEETLKRFQEAGLEERLKEKSLLVKEERILTTAAERIEPFKEVLEKLRRGLPLDRAFLSERALVGLPGKIILAEADSVLENMSQELHTVASRLDEVIKTADNELKAVHLKWEERKKDVQTRYEKILRELQKSKVDGEEFIQLRHQIEALRPLKERQTVLQRTREEHNKNRRSLLAEWEEVKREEFRELERAAKKVSKKLKDRVQVRVTYAGNREPLIQLISVHVKGRLFEGIEAIKNRKDLSLVEFASACREGSKVLTQKFGLSEKQAEKVARVEPGLFMQIEELDLPSTTEIELNIAPDGQPVEWKTLDQLSTGQKATAVLLLLLLESEAPLVIDQPEENLDNRFITDGVIPRMREEKRRRQFVFSTHNANIPVLGDAELILGLTATGEAEHGSAKIPTVHMGAIDDLTVREMVEEILEGGKVAFEMRRLKYGF
jgi:hypothetical protein